MTTIETMNNALASAIQAGARYKLVPPQHTPQGLAGQRLGNRPGSSLEFMDHRNYIPGDDLRRIDWSAYARSDKLTVRLYREEIDPHLEIIVDGSLSMALDGSKKSAAASAVAAYFAQAAGNSNYTYKLWLAGQECYPHPRSASSPVTWNDLEFDFNGSPAQALAKPAARMRARAMRLFISDLLWEGDPLETMLRLTENASSVFIVQVLAQADVNPPGPGNFRLYDSETGQMREIYIDATARQEYLNRMERHKLLWQQAARHCAAEITTIIDEPFIETMEIPDFIKKGILRVS